MQSKHRQMDAGVLANNAIPKPAEKLYDARGDTVRPFRAKEGENVEYVISPLDEFYIRLGVKDMPNTKAQMATTTPLEWNGKVLALIATIFTLLGILGGMVWYAASLAAKVEYIEKTGQEKSVRRDAQFAAMEQRIMRMEDAQRAKDLRDEAARGFKMGVAESESKK